MQKIKQKLAFTLVELIVVIIILTILWTVAFISLNWYTKTTRDTVRISDIAKIDRGLESFKLEAAVYPDPDDPEIITYSSSEVWTQWVFWESAFTNIASLDKVPVDPLTWLEYTYSVTSDRKEYEIATILESNNTAYNQVEETHAWEDEVYVRVSWDYNWKILRTYNWLDVTLLAVPSIIWAEITTLENLITGNKLVYDGYKNLPAIYNWTNFKVLWEDAEMNLVNKDKYLLYTWKEKDLLNLTTASQDARTVLTEKLQQAYYATSISAKGEILNILTMNTSDSIIVNNLISDILQEKIDQVDITTSITNLNCVWADHNETKDFWSTSSVSHTSWQAWCDNAKITFTCKDWEYIDLVTWADINVYQYSSCVVWIPIDCPANPSYTYNLHNYLLPLTTHGLTASVTSSIVSENNGSYTYDLSIVCSDGTFMTPSETGSNLSSCNTWYHSEDNSTCISDTKSVACIEQNKPENSTYNLVNVDITWNWTSRSTADDCTWTCDANYTSDWTSCISNTRSCTITNWTWTQTWDGSSWGECIVSSCDTGYVEVNNQCLGWWMAKDTNCDKTDIVVWSQTWAWCNSTLGTWIEFVSNSTYSCYNYVWTNNQSCTDAQNLSNAKENTWNATYWVDNIWWKIYTSANAASACPTWRHLPTIWEYNQLLRDLGCSDTLNDVSKWYLCSGLWWSWYQSKVSSNNLIQSLSLPLAWNRIADWNFINRWSAVSLWTSTVSWTWTVALWSLYNQDTIWHSAQDNNLAFSVRCIKDGSTPTITTNSNDGYFYVEGNELLDFDTTLWNTISIPSIVDGKTVTKVWTWVFMWVWLTSVSIPSTVTDLWYRSFYNNSLTSVSIPNSVTNISEEAFAYNSPLWTLNLGSSVTNIWPYAFYWDALTTVTVPASVDHIWEWAFRYNEISSLTLNEGLQTIWASAFDWYLDTWMTYGNAIPSVTIPSTVTSIWDRAFSENALETITFTSPSSVSYIWEWSFNYQYNSWNWTINGPSSWYILNTYSDWVPTSWPDDDEFDLANFPNYSSTCTNGQVWDQDNLTCVTPQLSCSHIKINFPTATDWVYWIDPDWATWSAPFKVYCDMTTEWGGWTYIIWIEWTNKNHVNISDVTSSNLSSLSWKWKFSDTVINSIAWWENFILRWEDLSNIWEWFLYLKYDWIDWSSTRLSWNQYTKVLCSDSLLWSWQESYNELTHQVWFSCDHLSWDVYDAYWATSSANWYCWWTTWWCSSWNKDARIWIRTSDFTDLSAQSSCSAHADLGRNLDWTYMIDPDWAGAMAAFEQTCYNYSGWIKSLRFNDDDSAYLSRAPSSAGNRKTWTWSWWVKIWDISGRWILFWWGHTYLIYDGEFRWWQMHVNMRNTDGVNYFTSFKPQLRDPSAWYHIVLNVDTSQANESDRLRLYLNGEEVEKWGDLGINYPPQNHSMYVNSITSHNIWRQFTWDIYFDGYMSNINFIDWQALTPDSFAYTDPTTGQYLPKDYTGTYGTNWFHLAFDNSSSIWADSSGMGNDWTVNNLAASDVMLDSPENNYATLNPLAKGEWVLWTDYSFSEWNTKIVTSAWSKWVWGVSTLWVDSGKWYYEFSYTNASNNVAAWWTKTTTPRHPWTWAFGATESDNWVGFTQQWTVYTQSSATTTWVTYSIWDILWVSIDIDNNKIDFYKNWTIVWWATNIESGIYYPWYWAYNTSTAEFNFGQGWQAGLQYCTDAGGQFKYCPPTGFKALSTKNLPDPSIVDPSEHFDVVTYTGNWGTQSIGGLGFQPDFVWVKNRTDAHNHRMVDSVYWTSEWFLSSNQTIAVRHEHWWITSINSNWFTVWPWSWQSTSDWSNTSGANFVAWNWKAGWAAVTNNDWTISSQVSANPEAGFSVIGYTGNWVSWNTIWHGLNKTPELAILKNRSSSTNWAVLTTAVDWSHDYMFLNTTGAKADNTLTNALDTTTFKVWSWSNWNENWANHIAYAFHSVPWYSKVWSYTGNWSADGPFVYTGFKPKYVMIKRTDQANWWNITDTARNPFNDGSYENLRAEDSEAERSNWINIDYMSNWFKLNSTQVEYNASWWNYIYIAFADKPFKYASAR